MLNAIEDGFNVHKETGLHIATEKEHSVFILFILSANEGSPADILTCESFRLKQRDISS